MLGEKEILSRFGFHAATYGTPVATGPIHHELRRLFIELASALDELVPDGRAKSIMFTELESAAMWGNKGIAEQAPVVDIYPSARAKRIRVENNPADLAEQKQDRYDGPWRRDREITDLYRERNPSALTDGELDAAREQYRKNTGYIPPRPSGEEQIDTPTEQVQAPENEQ